MSLPIYPAPADRIRWPGIEITDQWKTTITPMESGCNENRTKRWRFPKRSVNIPYSRDEAADVSAAWLFYRARSGAYEPFWLIVPTEDVEPYEDEFIARGDGITQSFDLPGKTTTLRSVYVDGVEDATATYASGTGEAGVDRVTFSSVPAEGALLTADFTGYLRLRARFAQDSLKKTNFDYLAYEFGVDFIEARIE